MLNERKIYIDYLRVFSCLAVIMIHVFTTARTDFPSHTTFEEIICKVIPNILHFSVPIFFMITGYLFLSTEKGIDLLIYLKKYVLKYIYAIFIFGFSFACLEEIFNKKISILLPINALINTLQGKTWNHMWYLYSLVGVMLFIPLLKIVLEKNSKALKYLSVILLTSTIIIPMINKIFNIEIGFDLLITSPYLLYAIIGFYIGNSEKNINIIISILGIILCTTIIIVPETIGVLSNNEIFSKLDFWGQYNSIIILILSVLIFNLFKNIRNENNIILKISQNTYGIYILHMFWINMIYKFLKYNIFGHYLIIKVGIVFILTFILSLTSTIILKHTPIIKKII